MGVVVPEGCGLVCWGWVVLGVDRVVLAEFLGIYLGACAEVRWGKRVEGFGWVEGIGVLRLRAARFSG